VRIERPDMKMCSVFESRIGSDSLVIGQETISVEGWTVFG